MPYESYISARDAAWNTLIACHVAELPVRPSQICKHYNWILADYVIGRESIELLNLSALTEKTDGFCTVTDNNVYIFFDKAMPTERQRFTVAHEIGHLILGHVGRGMTTVERREPTRTERIEERQANQFAARLLAPSWVLHEIGAVTPEQIQALCGISRQAAEFRARRMRELEHRNCYYFHPLEQQVVRQFASYIAVVKRG